MVLSVQYPISGNINVEPALRLDHNTYRQVGLPDLDYNYRGREVEYKFFRFGRDRHIGAAVRFPPA